jgi:phosphatidylglycerophosphatase C
VQTITHEAVVTRLDAARRARPGGAIAFDGDGTLWSGDVGDDLFRAFLAKGRVEPPAAAAIEAFAREHGVSARQGGKGGTQLAAAIYDAYLAGSVPEEPVCEVMTYACAGWPVENVVAFAREVVLGAGLIARLQSETARPRVSSSGRRTQASRRSS